VGLCGTGSHTCASSAGRCPASTWLYDTIAGAWATTGQGDEPDLGQPPWSCWPRTRPGGGCRGSRPGLPAGSAEAARLRDLPFPASFRPFAAYEAEATALYMFEHSLVLGLLQTPQYAQAVLATRPNTAEDEIDNLVTARLARRPADRCP
jgi:hypothetical protein